jgi:hypothetical protein
MLSLKLKPQISRPHALGPSFGLKLATIKINLPKKEIPFEQVNIISLISGEHL